MEKLEQELIQQLKSRVPVAFEIGAHIMNSGGKRVRPQVTVHPVRGDRVYTYSYITS
jgi:geranylgeranyl pyrophosphate synthase